MECIFIGTVNKKDHDHKSTDEQLFTRYVSIHLHSCSSRPAGASWVKHAH